MKILKQSKWSMFTEHCPGCFFHWSPQFQYQKENHQAALVTVAVIGCLAVLFLVLKWGAVEKTTLYMLFKQCIVQRQYFDTPWIGNITDCENLDWFLCSTLDKRSIREGCA